MTKATPKTPASNAARVENILAYMAVGVIGLALICIFATLISKAVGSSILTVFEQIPLLALPLGALLVIALFITAAIRRSREKG